MSFLNANCVNYLISFKNFVSEYKPKDICTAMRKLDFVCIYNRNFPVTNIEFSQWYKYNLPLFY